MPCISSLGAADRLLPWPSEAALEPLPSSAVEAFHEEAERPFDALISEVLSLIIEDEERAAVLIRDAIRAEREWQKIISARLDDERALFSQLQAQAALYKRPLTWCRPYPWSQGVS